MTPERIFRCSHEFVGRESELELIVAAAHGSQSLSLLAAPGVGSSELLKQAYDELFSSGSILPFYFELKRSDRDAAEAARRFAYEFLVHAVAHARQDPRIIFTKPSLDEIARLAPAEMPWIDAAIETLYAKPDIASCVGIPVRARIKVAVLIDALDRVRLIREGGRFLEAIAGLRGLSVVASGLRRAMYRRLPFRQIRVEPLGPSDTARVVEAIAERHAVELNDATRDLIAVQTEESLAIIDLLLAQAADDGESLTDFSKVERAYTNSIFGGLIARYLRERLLLPMPRAIDQNAAVRLFAKILASNGRRSPLSVWRRSLTDIDDAAFGRLIRHLHVEEAISAGDGTVNMSVTSRAIRDYASARAATLDAPEKRAAIVGRAMQHNLARAPRLMTEFYRSSAAVAVRDLLKMFEGQTIARNAIDYGPFKHELKGQDDDAILGALRSATDTLDLPRILYTADAAAYYPPLAELCDRDRAAVGLTESGEAWLAAEIDSKLEADAATTAFWCDRLEMAALNSGLDGHSIWLIAPEGFADEATEILAERTAYGSSRKQVELLKRLLAETPEPITPELATNYEIAVPMGDDGEMIAAKTFGDIATKHGIGEKVAGQIKTALIEALINAAEHSLSPDRRVELVFSVTADTITITVTNRGLRLTAHMLSQTDGPSERRGWGLKMIRELMDEVSVEPTDDGTRLVMIKQFG